MSDSVQCFMPLHFFLHFLDQNVIFSLNFHESIELLVRFSFFDLLVSQGLGVVAFGCLNVVQQPRHLVDELGLDIR